MYLRRWKTTIGLGVCFAFMAIVHSGPLATAHSDGEYDDPWDPQSLGVPVFNEAISRAVTVYNQIGDSAGQNTGETVSRAVTVYNQFNENQGETIAEAVSRAVTVDNVFNQDQGQTAAESHSRAVTLCNLSAFVDEDGDTVHDCLDICPGFPDTVDTDSDGTPDGCDVCPTDPGPMISAQPTGDVVCEGESITFTVSASGTPALMYQWFKDGVPILGANADSYTIDPVTPADAGAYTVIVTNACGEQESESAVLTVTTLASCDDVNACTADSCTAGVCDNVPTVGAMCSDGDPCTLNDTCDMTANCVGVPMNCDDVNLCTSDACVAGACVNTPLVGSPCDDGNACTEADACNIAAMCVGATVNCDDMNACTDDSCDTIAGCQHVNNNNPCNDGNACTKDDVCVSGSCAGTPFVQLYADVAPPGGNGTVNLDDILCLIAGFANPGNCPDGDIHPCGGNGSINLDDILAVLAAFSGNYGCPHPCPP